MPRRRKPAGLECLVELARKAAILEKEMSAQRQAIDRLLKSASPNGGARDRAGRAASAPSPPAIRWCPDSPH